MRTLWALIVLGLALPRSVNADALDAANWARQHGCGPAVIHSGLQSSGKLHEAATRMAVGAPLRDTLRSVGYVAAQSSALHLSGSLTDTEIRRALCDNFCTTLTNSQFSDIGIARRGRDIWLVLAQPVNIPGIADAPAVAKRILELVNAARGAGARCGNRYFPPVLPLTLNSSLDAAALAHSRDMALHGEFEHRGHDASTPEARVQIAGYGPHRIVGENIATGAMSAVEVTQGWLASPAHCENIMDGRFTQIGIAFAANPSNPGALYWTQDFAAPR